LIWSISDSKTFRRCQRQWYYKAIAGSARAADPFRRKLYLLGKLQSISAWRGQIVDSVITDVLIPAIGWKRRVTLEQLKNAARQRFQRQLACARKHELLSPGFSPTALGEDFAAFHCLQYGQGIDESELKKAGEEVEQALTNLFSMDAVKELLKSATRLVAQRALLFDHSGVKVRAVPDVVAFFNNRPPVIVDWKVHFFGLDEAWRQLAVYALALTRCKPHRDFPAEIGKYAVGEIELVEVQLLTNQVRRFTLEQDEVEAAEAYIAESVTEMTLAVDGRKADELSAEEFSVAWFRSSCQACGYKCVCWGEQE
jgi:PD-(D/E)XK nuclease superfamily